MFDANHRMKPLQRRALSEGEIAIGQTMFAEEIPWRQVRLWQAPPLNFGAMVPLGRGIVFSNWRAPEDFAVAPLSEQGWFIHELAHVWQAERGIVLAFAKLGALGARAYGYGRKAGARLDAYNIEQQAEIARHLFLARAGAPAKRAPEHAFLERIWSAR